MRAKIEFDPIGLLVDVANEQYEVDCIIGWVSGLHDDDGAWARTHFDDDPPAIEVDVSIPVYALPDILAHEIAHVIAGHDAGHGPEWEDAFDTLRGRYEFLVTEMQNRKTDERTEK